MVDAETTHLLHRSTDLHDAFHTILSETGIYDLDKAEASMRLCVLAMEHAQSILSLFGQGSNISAISLVRLQFEALVRAMWVWQCANESQLQKLTMALSPESLQAAKNLPGVHEMLRALEKSKTLHPNAKEMLLDIKEALMAEMNSFIHAGMMPYVLLKIGTPLVVVHKTLKNSNAISTMTAMLMSILTGDKDAVLAMSKIQPQFSDCLPPLLKPSN